MPNNEPKHDQLKAVEETLKALEKVREQETAREVSAAMQEASKGQGVEFKPGYPSDHLAEKAKAVGIDTPTVDILSSQAHEKVEPLSDEEQKRQINLLILNPNLAVKVSKEGFHADKLSEITDQLGQ